MPSDFHEQKPQPSVEDKKASGESQRPLTPDEIRAGTKVVMTPTEWQAFLKNSPLGQVLGVSHLLESTTSLPPKSTITLKATFEATEVRPLVGKKIERYYLDSSNVRNTVAIEGVSPKWDLPETGELTTTQSGVAYRSQEEVTKAAIDYYQQSLDIARETGDRSGEANLIGSLGNAYYSLGQYDLAIDYYQQSLELNERIDNVQGKAATLHNLAGIKANQGEIANAIALYQQSLELKERSGDVQGKAAALTMIGQLLLVQGDFETGQAILQKALDILQQMSSPDALAVKQILARVEQMAGD